MSEHSVMTPEGRRITLNTPEEDAAITEAAASDPDAQPLSDEQWRAIEPRARGGRPRAAVRKVSTTIRFDADVLEAMKATGPGWQTRINEIVRKHVEAELRD